MTLYWRQAVFSNLYPVISHLYPEELKGKRLPEANIRHLRESIGSEVEKKIRERFGPSFFNRDHLCERNSLVGRVSSLFFFICLQLGLSRFDERSKLCSLILRAERSWLGELLNDADRALGDTAENKEERKRIDKALSCVVTQRGEVVSKKEIKTRLNQLVSIADAFYRVHGVEHSDVTSRVPHTYFELVITED